MAERSTEAGGEEILSTETVYTAAEFASAIARTSSLAAGVTHVIVLSPETGGASPTLMLTGDIPTINTAAAQLTIQSQDPNSPVIIDGKGEYRGFVVLSGMVQLNNLNIANAVAKGATGCLGAGGGLFVANVLPARTGKPPTNPYSPRRNQSPNAIVYLKNVTFTGCAAYGGAAPTGGSGGSVGRGTPPFEDGENGAYGSGGPDAVGTGPFGASAPGEAGWFGIAGAGGSRGGYGAGGIWGDSPAPGLPGGRAGSGGAAGYGAGGGAGGGGGGGGGGVGIVLSTKHTPGGDGGPGGKCGPPGFGGGGDPQQTPKPPGTGAPDKGDGDGGRGADGVDGGAGAGLGGAVFVMDQAQLHLSNSVSVSACTAGAGSGGSGKALAAGGGVFLQGSGTLHVNPALGDVQAVSDPIADEVGVSSSPPTSKTGPDNLPIGGGGTWGLAVDGGGTLTLQGQHAFSGDISLLTSATLDLSDFTGTGSNSLTMEQSTRLVHQPAKSRAGGIPLHLDDIRAQEEDGTVRLALNGYSRLGATRLTAANISLALNPAGFPKTGPVDLLTTKKPLPKGLTCSPVPGYTVQCTTHTIQVSRKA
ncbi:MAG: hypothetical protein WA962_00020 [Ornithinimicrobium sp.]